MKKNLFFNLFMIIVMVVLFMLSVTGIKVHIGVSLVGLVLVVTYTLLAKKEWKNPILEILSCVIYAIALITGAIVMNVYGIALISIIHKVSAVLFVVVLAYTQIHKAIKK